MALPRMPLKFETPRYTTAGVVQATHYLFLFLFIKFVCCDGLIAVPGPGGRYPCFSLADIHTECMNMGLEKPSDYGVRSSDAAQVSHKLLCFSIKFEVFF